MATLAEKLTAMPILDSLQRTENPLATANWEQLAEGVNNPGQCTATGWTTAAASTDAGALWKGSLATAEEFAVGFTLAVVPGANEQFVAFGFLLGAVKLDVFFFRLSATEAYVALEHAGTTVAEGTTPWAAADQFRLALYEGKGRLMRKPSAGSWEEKLSAAASAEGHSASAPYIEFSHGPSSNTAVRLTNFAAGTLAEGKTVELPLAPAVGSAATSLSLHTPTRLPLGPAQGSAATSLALSVPSKAILPLSPAQGSAATALLLVTKPRLQLSAAGSAQTSMVLSTPPPPSVRRLERKPPLALDLEAENAEGDVTHFHSDSRKAANRPFAGSCGSERGEGFSTGNVSFNRDIYRDYPDLNLLDTWRFVGREGSVAYEGRLAQMPRTNSPAPTITLNLVGWMSYLKSRPVTMLIIDRRLGGWVEPSTQRKADIYSAGAYRYEGALSSGWQSKGALGPAVLLSFATFDASTIELGEAWLYAGGEDIDDLRFDFARLQGSAIAEEFHTSGYLSSDDLASAYDQGADLHVADANGVVVSATVPGRKYALLATTFIGAFVGTGPNDLAFVNPRIVGSHGLTPIGASPEEGYGLSDIVEYMLATYFPKVSLAPDCPRSTFPVQQWTGHDKEDDGVATLQGLNNLILWETSIFEDRQLRMEPADLTTVDWWIDTTWPGVTVNYQGPTVENLANGIEVVYEDFFEHTFRLRPDEFPELLDPNPNNPATRQGEDLWIRKTVPWQCTSQEAIQFGIAQLAEYNRPRRPGSFTVAGGYVKDAAGHWQQGWKVRNSQTLGVKNHPDESEARLIYTPRWDLESKSLTIAVDAPPQTLDAIVARQQLAREAKGY